MICPRCMFLRALRPRNFLLQPSYQKHPFSTTCPRSLAPPRVSRSWMPTHPARKSQQRNFSSIPDLGAASTDPFSDLWAEPDLIECAIPLCCPGCGAFSQTIDPNEPGYYSKTRKQTRKRLAETNRISNEKRTEEGQEGSADLKTQGEDAARDILQLIAAKQEGKKPPQPTSA